MQPVLSVLLAAALAGAALAQDGAPSPAAARLTVFVVAARDDARTAGWLDLLRAGGMLPRLVDRAACTPEALRPADVVLVDWPASDALGERLPLGPFARWDVPTVFVHESGDVFARRWGLPTAAEMAALVETARGPEMDERRSRGGAKTVVWRQGLLFHFPLAADAGSAGPEERDWLLQTIALAPRFAADRPLLRHPMPHGEELPIGERERRERIAAASRTLAIEPTERAALLALPDRLEGLNERLVAQLLVDLIHDGPDVQTTKNNWHNWLRGRGEYLVFDPLTQVWRLDALAHRRALPPATSRGDARADGAEREPAAVALATKVVLRHGGRALPDLATFSCWRGDVHCAWDRRGGYLRLENHAAPERAARVTPWTVAVMDTAADEELIWGGGPPPRPRVSGRSTWRHVVEQLLLPAMLLDPAVSLRRSPDHDLDGAEAIGVRLGGRGMDARQEHIVLVDPATGDVVRVRTVLDGRVRSDLRVVARTQCGPLLLATEFVDEQARDERRISFVDVRWNPDLPKDLATATERLTKPAALPAPAGAARTGK